MSDKQLSITITTGTILKVALVGIGLWLAYILFDLVLVLLTAIVIASAIEPATKWFIQRKIPRTAAVLIVYLIFFTLFFGFFYFFVPPVLIETAGFVSQIPSYLEELNPTSFEYGPILSAAGADTSTTITGVLEQVRSALASISQNAFSAASLVFGGVMSFIFVLVFSFYFAMQETGIDDFLRIITPIKHQRYVIDLWRRSQDKIGRWLQGQLLLGLIVGVLVYLGLTILGVKYALVLAVLAALFELIPVFGPILSAIPAVIIAFVDGGLTLGILVIALYVIIQQFENHLIYPLVVTKVVGVPPLLVIIALIVGAQLAGFLGIILSVPIVAVIQELIHDMQTRRAFVLGEETEQPANPTT